MSKMPAKFCGIPEGVRVFREFWNEQIRREFPVKWWNSRHNPANFWQGYPLNPFPYFISSSSSKTAGEVFRKAKKLKLFVKIVQFLTRFWDISSCFSLLHLFSFCALEKQHQRRPAAFLFRSIQLWTSFWCLPVAWSNAQQLFLETTTCGRRVGISIVSFNRVFSCTTGKKNTNLRRTTASAIAALHCLSIRKEVESSGGFIVLVLSLLPHCLCVCEFFIIRKCLNNCTTIIISNYHFFSVHHNNI